MKKVLSLLCVMFFCASLAGAGCKEHQCAICGKTIYEWTEDYPLTPYGSFGDVIIMGNSGYCSGVRAYEMPNISRYVCIDCYNKCQEALAKHIEDFYIQCRFENRNLIEQHEEERKQKAILHRQGRIKALSRELKKLKEGK